MKPKLNYHYSIPYKKVGYFAWKKYNDVVDLTLYKERIMPKLIDIRKQCINYQLTHYKIQFFDNAIILTK